MRRPLTRIFFIYKTGIKRRVWAAKTDDGEGSAEIVRTFYGLMGKKYLPNGLCVCVRLLRQMVCGLHQAQHPKWNKKKTTKTEKNFHHTIPWIIFFYFDNQMLMTFKQPWPPSIMVIIIITFWNCGYSQFSWSLLIIMIYKHKYAHTNGTHTAPKHNLEATLQFIYYIYGISKVYPHLTIFLDAGESTKGKAIKSFCNRTGLCARWWWRSIRYTVICYAVAAYIMSVRICDGKQNVNIFWSKVQNNQHTKLFW